MERGGHLFRYPAEEQREGADVGGARTAGGRTRRSDEGRQDRPEVQGRRGARTPSGPTFGIVLPSGQEQGLLLPDQPFRPAGRTDSPPVQTTVADRAALQKDKAELPVTVFLRRQPQCHTDTDLVHTYRPVAYNHNETDAYKAMELLQSGEPVAEAPVHIRQVHRFFRQRGRLCKGFCQEQGRTGRISGKTGFFRTLKIGGLTF